MTEEEFSTEAEEFTRLARLWSETFVSAIRSLAAERDKAQGYLSRCLQSLYPNIEPLPDLLGVCTQIDNVLAGQKAENARLREALAECNVWVTAAIECKDWMWDGDQKEAAIFARDQARAALGETQ